MKEWTDEQRATQDALQAALEAHNRAWSPAGADPGLLVDWVVVTQTTRFDDDGDRISAYGLIFAGGQMDEHRAVGLLDYGSHLLKFGGRSEPEE
jgi:hypothetical protein